MTEPLAYGFMHLKPSEYEELQVREFHAILEGMQAYEKSKDKKIAYYLTWLVNVQVKHPVSVLQILEGIYPELPREAEAMRKARYEEDSNALKEIFKDVL